MEQERTLRGEIQGLRALAVILVVIYHLWPQYLPGGYVGVDVFFVISGYLICGSLAREAERTGRVSLLGFYARRVRRLLPAATVVLLFSIVGIYAFIPEPRWEDSFEQVLASALYVENWFLARASVDYLAAENAASPVQHFWSLSIEEQFYIFWPLVVLGFAALARWRGWRVGRLLGWTLGAGFALSLALSIVLTRVDADSAYFVTPTRAWELALGGLLAMWLPRLEAGAAVRAGLLVVGITMIIVSGFAFGSVPFPGYAALLPTLGAVAVIAAGDVRIGGFAGLNVAPLRYIGDISYSLYLWHWPIIIFFLASGGEVGMVEGLALGGAAFALGALSYHFVEQRYRHAGTAGDRWPLVYGLGSVAAVVLLAGVSYYDIIRPLGNVVLDPEQYPGPATLIAGVPTPAGIDIFPPATRIAADRADVYDNGCHQNQRRSDIKACTYGDPNGAVRVALVGSSHSVNWLPSLDALGKKNGWQVISITKSSCNFRSSDSPSCDTWQDNLVDYLRDNPVAAVVIGEMDIQKPDEAAMMLVAERWAAIAALDEPIIAIRPTPIMDRGPGQCLPRNPERCAMPRAVAERLDVTSLAVDTVPGVIPVNLNDAICSPSECGPVVGNLVVFRDRHHLTATYSRALAPILERRIVDAAPGLLPIRDVSP